MTRHTLTQRNVYGIFQVSKIIAMVENGDRGLVGRFVDRARTNFHRTDAQEYHKRANMDIVLSFANFWGLLRLIEINDFGASEIIAPLVIIAMVGGAGGRVYNSEKERRAEIDEAVHLAIEGLSVNNS